MRYLVLVLALALACGTLLPAAIASADEGDIEILDVNVESQFPDGVRFAVTARSSEEIDDIRVFFTKASGSGVSAYRPLDFQPGTEVTGESILSTVGGSNYFPPGTLLKFSFEVTDKAGSVLRTPEEDFVYQDNRFEWLSVKSGLITVYYYGEYVEERAKIVLDAAEKAMDRMLPILGIAPTEELRVVSYNNYRHMSTALPFRSQTVREQLQTQGMAFSEERVLLVHGFDSTIQGTASHEFTHLLVAEAAGRAKSLVPAWLNEGLDEFGNIDPTDDYEAAQQYGIFTRRLKPLWYLDSFSGTPDDIVIAYGQGRSVVNFMLLRWDPGKMAELFQVLQRTLDIDLALEEVYGLDQYGLDTEWRLAIGIEPLPSPEELRLQLEEQPPAELATVQAPEAAPLVDPTPEQGEAPAPAPEVNPSPTASAGDAGESEPAGQVAAGDAGDAQESEAAAQPAAGGCNSPAHSAGPTPLGLGGLLLMAAPLGLLSLRMLRRGTVRRNEATCGPVAEDAMGLKNVETEQAG